MYTLCIPPVKYTNCVVPMYYTLYFFILKQKLHSSFVICMYALCVFIAHRLCIPPVSSSRRQKLTDASAPKCIIALLPTTTSTTSTSHWYYQHHHRHHHLRYHEMCQFTPSSPSLPSFSAKDLLAKKPG